MVSFCSYHFALFSPRHLVSFARQQLGPNVVLYTTDPPDRMKKGSLSGSAVLTVPDFGPEVDAEMAFRNQAKMNPLGLSPRLNSEYYTGWIASWAQNMANTSSAQVASSLDRILSLNASVNFYMGFGGTNFGFWSGGNAGNEIAWTAFTHDIQSYDYDAPISESGIHGYGSDGVDKFVAMRKI